MLQRGIQDGTGFRSAGIVDQDFYPELCYQFLYLQFDSRGIGEVDRYGPVLLTTDLDNPFTARRRASGLRAIKKQFAPLSASSCAAASPIPCELPQMRAFLLSNEIFIQQRYG